MRGNINNNYKCKICRNTGKKFQYGGYHKYDNLETRHWYREVECNCVEITNLTTEEDLNNNLMRIEVKNNV